MIITKETKERFIKMLKDRQIIVIQADLGKKRKTYDLKFIGANNDDKWDFTPLVVETSGYPSNRRTTVERLAIHALDAVSVVCDTLNKLQEEYFECNLGEGYSQYQKVRDLLTIFYI